MIGGDGSEYGPVSADELRQWIREYRANGQTLVKPEGGTDWQPLAAFPEFAEDLREGLTAAGLAEPSAPAQPAAGSEPEAGEFRPGTDLLAATATAAPREFSVMDCIGHGWALLGRHFFLLVGASSLLWLILTASALATCIGGLIGLVISGPLYGGLLVIFLRLSRGQSASLGDLFAFFGPGFVALMLTAIVTQVLSQIGLIFCVVPGLCLKVLWAFALPLAADHGVGIGLALSGSFRVASRHFFRVAGLLLIAYLPLIVFELYSGWRIFGFLTDVLGPAGAWKFDQIQARQEEIAKFLMTLGLEEQFVLLLNLPFACAAVTQAYEALFGTRTPRVD